MSQEIIGQQKNHIARTVIQFDFHEDNSLDFGLALALLERFIEQYCYTIDHLERKLFLNVVN